MSAELVTQSRPSFKKMLPGETAHGFDAFCYFRDLGPDRNLGAVAEKMGLTVGSISSWSGRFQWQARARFHDEVMSHVAVEAKKAATHDAMVEEYAKVQAARYRIGTALRDKVEAAIPLITKEQLARNPRLIPILLGYVDRTENDMFSPVRREGGNESEDINLINLKDLTDEQLDELARVADSISLGQRTD